MFGHVVPCCPMEEDPLGGFHQQEIGSGCGSYKDKITERQRRESEHARKGLNG